MRRAVCLAAVFPAVVLTGCGGFGGTYVNKTSSSMGPGGHKQETIKIVFHRNGTFDAYDGLTGTWKLKGDQLTMKVENGLPPGMQYQVKVVGKKIIFQTGAPNFAGGFGVTFEKTGLF